MSELKDSGARREFETGAVRDIAEGKGRCDLLPLRTLGVFMNDQVFIQIDDYIRTGRLLSLWSAFTIFVNDHYASIYDALLDVAKQYEDGGKKYNDRNWEIGIPTHCYIDSAVRHYIKFKTLWIDEPHDRAFMWNILCAMWTHQNKPELNDLPFVDLK